MGRKRLLLGMIGVSLAYAVIVAGMAFGLGRMAGIYVGVPYLGLIGLGTASLIFLMLSLAKAAGDADERMGLK